MPCSFYPCQSIQGPVVVEPRLFSDKRGFFMETFKRSEFMQAGIEVDFVQDNQSLSVGPVIRGLHFQLPPRQQGKLLRAVEGRIWDLAVDLRPDSPTFLRWLAVELDDQSNRMFYIPPGFAHGFATLSPRAQLFYKCSAEYDPQLDSGIRWNDPTLAIPWPIDDAQISAKDNDLPLLDSDFFRSLRW